MAKAARFDRLRECFELHLLETEAQIERINECFGMLGEKVRATPCTGMAGLVEEGQEVMAEGENKPDALADLGLIGAAQRVEKTTKSLPTRPRRISPSMPGTAPSSRCCRSRLPKRKMPTNSSTIARSLMSVAEMPAVLEQTIEE